MPIQRRKPSYLQHDERQRDRWLFSYTDVVTILLILFVSIAAQTLQAHRLKQQPPPKQTMSENRAPSGLLAVQEKLKNFGLQQKIEERGLVITLPQAILFASGDDRIAESAMPIVGHIADAIRTTGHRVQLVGHADAIPIHNRRFENNWALSAARSLQLLSLLTSKFGIDESRMEVVSHGATDPRDSNDTNDGRAENRRVEIVISEPVSKLASVGQ